MPLVFYLSVYDSDNAFAINMTCASQESSVSCACKKALFTIAFLRSANAFTNEPIKWHHKNAKIVFIVSASQNCDSNPRVFVTSLAHAFAV